MPLHISNPGQPVRNPFRRPAAAIETPSAPQAEAKSFMLTDGAALELFGAIPAGTGISVGPSSAMRVPAVSCAVGLISETTGTLPAKLYSREDKATARDHPAFALVHDEANPWTSAAELRTQLTTDALLHGHGFAQVVRIADGEPAELHRLDPSRVTPKADTDGAPWYEVRTDRGAVRLRCQDVLHVSAFGGVSPITLGREAIALALAYEQHAASLFSNGARPSGIIKSPKTLDVDAKRKLAASWFNTHSGKRVGGTAILDEALEFQQLSLTLVDAQFQEGRLEQIREIARIFRVPPTMLFELTRGTWSNTEEMARQFLAVTLKPWLETWSWAYARALLSPEERRQLYVEFITDDLLSTSHAARATAYGQYRSMGAITGNEVRAGLNLPPLPGGDVLQNPYTTSGSTPAPEAPAEEPQA